MFLIRFVSLALFASVLAAAPALAAEGAPFDVGHGKLAQVLNDFVKKGRVDYSGIKAKGLGALDGYLAEVAKADPSALSKDDRLALYINAYNACVLREVVKRMPVESVIKEKDFFKTDFCNVGGKKMSLDTLEKGVINPTFKEPRTHFALVCAAKSCPPLRSEPWVGKNIDGQLETATRSFLATVHGAKVSGSMVKLSKLFEWYAGDFGGPEGAKRFVSERHAEAAKALKGGAKVGFLDYEWALNRR